MLNSLESRGRVQLRIESRGNNYGPMINSCSVEALPLAGKSGDDITGKAGRLPAAKAVQIILQ